MLTSQNQIRNLFIATMAIAATRGRPNDVAFINSEDHHFKYVVDAALDIDDSLVFQGFGTDGRWVRTGGAIETFLPSFELAADLAAVTAHAAPDLNVTPNGLALYNKDDLHFYTYDEDSSTWVQVGDYAFNSEMLEVVVGANVATATAATFASVLTAASATFTASESPAKVVLKDAGAPLYLNGIMQERATKTLTAPYSAGVSITIPQGLYVGDVLQVESYYPLTQLQLVSAYKEMHI